MIGHLSQFLLGMSLLMSLILCPVFLPQVHAQTSMEQDQAPQPKAEQQQEEQEQAHQEELKKVTEPPLPEVSEGDAVTAPQNDLESDDDSRETIEEDPIAEEKLPSPKAVPPALRYRNGNSDFQEPLYFDPLENGITLKPLVFEYDLEKGSDLIIGPFVLNPQTLYMDLGPLRTLAPELSSNSEIDLNQQVLSLHWPSAFSPGGTLEVLSWTGTVLWSAKVGKLQKRLWEVTLEDWKKGIAARSPLFTSLYGVADFSLPTKWAEEKGPFRFCLTQEIDGARGRLCTGRYVLKPAKEGLKLVFNPERIPPRVVMSGKAAPLKRQVIVSEKGSLFSFFAELNNGISYEFASLPKRPKMLDFVRSNDGKFNVVMGYGLKPVYEDTVELNPEDPKLFWNRIGWQQTIGDLRTYWRVAFPSSDTSIYMRGDGGGIFRQELVFAKQPPKESSRIWLREDTPKGTYSWAPWYEGIRPPGHGIGTNEAKVIPQKKSNEFDWKFKASKRMATNRSHIRLKTPEKIEYTAHREVVRGNIFDVSARLSTAVADVGGLKALLMTEYGFGFWPENIFGWNSELLSRQRWGITGRYFQSITSATFTATKYDENGDPYSISKSLALSSSNIDLRYRFRQGLWGRDETWGMLLGYTDQKVLGYRGTFMGPGFFWARSMPAIFDQILNVIPMFRYPKFVDMDFTMYLFAMDPKKARPINDFVVNFHGKVMWTKSFYGEAGYGVRVTQYVATRGNEKPQNAKFDTNYGLVGLGYSF